MTLVDILETKEFITNMRKLSESIWSDIQDRSTGETIRKEDDVDLITDRKVFRDYLKKHYKETDTSGVYEIEAGHYCDRVTVPVCWEPGVAETKYLSIEDFAADDRYMTITYNISKFPDIYKLLSDNYRLSILRDLSGKPDVLDIESKDRSKVTNKFFLEVLDLLLNNIAGPLEPLVEKKTGVNESIWSDIQDRSTGETIRKEDDINRMNCDELYDYIHELYEQINPFPVPLKSGEGTSDKKIQYFSIPIFKVDYKVYRLDVLFMRNKISKLTLMATDKEIEDFKRPLADNFNVFIRLDKALDIEEKDGSLTNQTCMKLISFIVENAPEPYLKKREN